MMLEFDLNWCSHIESKYSVLFFDMDGTIVKSDISNSLAYQKAIFDVIGEMPLVNEISNERITRDSLWTIIPSLKMDDFIKIVELKESYYDQFLCELQINNDILEIINKYRGLKLLVLVTNSSEKRAMAILKFLDLLDKFDFLLFQNNLDSNWVNKYLKALTIFAIDPANVLCFEDDDAEIMKAKVVGIKAIVKITK
jgi:beta-phosphoglucomutase